MTGRRITLFAGHYGSGKTNIALNFARRLRAESPHVAVADLDIVNPYFRTKDSAAELSELGIELVVSEFANSNVDFPAMPKDAYAIMADRGKKVVVDVGGDDRGALALGRYVDDIRAEGDYEMLAVVNASRPLTSTPEDTVAVLREIESACSLPFTGIVNNTNLGQKTTAATVLGSLSYAGEIAKMMGVPVKFTCCAAFLEAELRDSIEALFPLKIQKLYYHMES